MKKLNLGCGEKVLDGYENYDKYNPDAKYIDLEKLPLIEFNDNSYDEILLLNVLEHLWLNPYDFMLEMYRILKTGGIIKIELPFFAPVIGHVRWFHKKTYFNIICNKPMRNKGLNSCQANKMFDLVDCHYVYLGWNRVTPRLHIYWELKKCVKEE